MTDSWRTDALWREIQQVTVLEQADGKLHRVQMVLSDTGRDCILRVTSESPLTVEMAPFKEYVGGSGWKLRDCSEIAPRDQVEVNRLFHHLWTAAGEPGKYVKSEWKQLAEILARYGYKL